jgi:hypothetical protein
MCRAVKVLCVAPDRESLLELKRAAVGAAWELAPGAVTAREAIEQLADLRPHVLVVAGRFEELIHDARVAYPGLRIIADAPAEGVDAIADEPSQIRDLIAGIQPAGPVHAPRGDAP